MRRMRDAMRTCYLHIGPNKTGTSTIQAALFENRNELRDAGIYVPEMNAAKARSNHHLLANEMNFDRTDAYRRALSEELRFARLPPDVLISSENFSARIHEKDARDRIYGYFSALGYAVVIIAFVRPQVDAINSIYAERVKKLINCQPFDEFLSHFLVSPRADLNAKFGHVLADVRFQTVFIPFNTHIIGAGLVSSVLTAVRLPEDALSTIAKPDTRNESPGPKTIAAMQEIGLALERGNYAIKRDRRSQFAKTLRKMAGELGWNGQKYYGPSREQRQLIIDTFSRSNNDFALAVWKNPWSEIFRRRRKPRTGEEMHCARSDTTLAGRKTGIRRILHIRKKMD